MSPNPAWFAHRRDAEWAAPRPDERALAFHRRLAGYGMTPLIELPRVARELGVGRVFAKDESRRLGLPAFKALGASWAVRRVLDNEKADAGQVTIVTATDGNHGRAVARFALHFGQRATVFVPDGVHGLAIEAIRAEGADVVYVDGSMTMLFGWARLGDEDGYVLVQDTAWDGYEDVPGWIVDGYDTLFVEIDEQLGAVGIDRPDLVVFHRVGRCCKLRSPTTAVPA